MLCAGQLRQYILIQTATKSRTDHGSTTSSWSAGVAAWAKIEPKSGDEIVEGDKITGKITHKVTMRYYDGLVPEMRIVHDSRNLYIKAVLDIMERNRMHIALCEERE